MAASLNRVFLIGNLTRDPELRYVPSGTAVVNFDLAVNRVFVTQSGEKKEEVCYIRVVVWGRRAEVCGEYLSKGSPVFVEGRLRSRTWQTQDGQKRSTIEVVATSVQFLRGQKDRQVSVQEFETEEAEINLDNIGVEPTRDNGIGGNSDKGSGEGQDEEIPF